MLLSGRAETFKEIYPTQGQGSMWRLSAYSRRHMDLQRPGGRRSLLVVMNDAAPRAGVDRVAGTLSRPRFLSRNCYGAAPHQGGTKMKCVLAITGLALLLVACSPTDPCRSHADEASCVADKACKWNTKKDKCKAAKKGKKSPQSERATTPAPSEQGAPPMESAPSAEPNANYSSPSTDTQPQPTYPEGGPQ